MKKSILFVRGPWKSILSLAAAIAIGGWLALSTSTVKADDLVWWLMPEAEGGYFGWPENWAGPYRVPTLGDTAIVNLTTASTMIYFDGSYACDSFQLWSDNDSYSCNLNGYGSLSLSTGPASLIAGGNLTLRDGVQIFVGSGGVSVSSGKQFSLVDYTSLSSTGGLQNSGSLSIGPHATLTTTLGLDNSSSLTLNGGKILGPGILFNEFWATISANGLIDAPLQNDGQLTLTGPLELRQTSTNQGSISIPNGKVLQNNGAMLNNGAITLSNGGIAGSGSLVNGASGIIRGTGAIATTIVNSGGLINSTGGTLVLSHLTSNSYGGELRIDQNTTMNLPSPLNNSGLISTLGDNASLLGELITNSGSIVGLGRITNPIANSGTIVVNSAYPHTLAPATLILSGQISNASAGIIQLLDNSQLTVVQGLANNHGQIILNNATFDNGNSPLVNNGYITGSGTLRISNLQNASGGNIGVGTGDMSVTGSVHNNGKITVQSGCKMTFFGPVSGSGAFPGSGAVQFLAGFSPGNSPASVPFGGDVTLAGGLTIELGGMEPGTQHDQLVANGAINVAGNMDLRLIGGYHPMPGDRMTVLRGDSLNGRFSTITGTTPGDGIELHPVYSPSSLVILTGRTGENLWVLDGNGNSSAGVNWTSGSAPQTAGGSAAFTSMITANRTVSVDSDLVVGTLSFNSDHSYFLQGPKQIKLRVNAGDAAVNVIGYHTIDAMIDLGCDAAFVVANTAEKNSSLTLSGAITDINNNASEARNLTKSGDGILVLAAENSYHGITKISGGQLELAWGGNISSSSEIENDAIFLVNGGVHSTPQILGSGETRVMMGTLTTSSITQGTLSIGSNGAVFAVPEPKSIALILLAAFAMVGWRCAMTRFQDEKRG